MINKDSIVTAYDEHLTLVEWLQKVENALNNAVLTNLGIAKLSDKDNVATYQVTASFADNTTIVSNAFTLPSTDIVTAFSNLTTLVNGFDTRITDNTNKLARALLTPSSAPSTRKVVTIDTNGAQNNVDGTELTTLMNNIVDSHGNKRFVEGNIAIEPISGVTKIYGKWSLSGTHLMIRLILNFANNTTLEGSSKICTINLPQWIMNKITSLYDVYISFNNFNTSGNGADTTIKLSLRKFNTNALAIYNSATAYVSKRFETVQIQFDLLIDSD